MAEDIRLKTGFPRHVKTKYLVAKGGRSAGWSLMTLWCYAGENKTDGDLSGMPDVMIETAADWDGDPGRLIALLTECGFLVGEAGARAFHDWEDHQPWCFGAEDRSEKGQLAALSKHHGMEKARRIIGQRKRRKSMTNKAQASLLPASDPDSTEQAPLPSPSPSPSPIQRTARKVENPITLRAYVAGCEQAGKQAIPDTDPVFEYARTIGIPTEYLELAWAVFFGKYTIDDGGHSRRQANWPQKFRNAVKENWYRLWYPDADGKTFNLTTAGKQAKLEHGGRKMAVAR